MNMRNTVCVLCFFSAAPVAIHGKNPHNIRDGRLESELEFLRYQNSDQRNDLFLKLLKNAMDECRKQMDAERRLDTDDSWNKSNVPMDLDTNVERIKVGDYPSSQMTSSESTIEPSTGNSRERHPIESLLRDIVTVSISKTAGKLTNTELVLLGLIRKILNENQWDL